jgi:formamidopyrimidine-DNA glycosylase
MPELPDVEHNRRELSRWLEGARIDRARTADRWIARPASPARFGRLLSGQRVQDVSRKGKWLRIGLESGVRLFSHLGMTGWWVAVERGAPATAAERAQIDVGDRSVRYLDPRRFGRLIVSREDIPEWDELGPDPLADGIRVDRLARLLETRKRAIKDALMDQSILAGIGNILATEALWRARIDPRSPSSALSIEDLRVVARHLRGAIRDELRTRERGEEDVFAVYGKAGEPCPRCGATIASVVIGGRTSAYCPRCQKRR